MRIAVDAMGGDFAPNAVVAGAYQAATRGRDPPFSWWARRPTLEATAGQAGRALSRAIEVVPAEEVVGMDEPPITPLRKKKRSSIRICGEQVKEGRAQAMVSAGNTGASLIVAKTVIGAIKGVDQAGPGDRLSQSLAAAPWYWMSAPTSTASPSTCGSSRSWAISTPRRFSALTSPRVGLDVHRRRAEARAAI